MKRHLSALVALIIILFSVCGCDKTNHTDQSFNEIEYRTDLEPIVNRFPILKDIKQTYWKTMVIGNSKFGPTNYLIVGFVVLSDVRKNEFENKYHFNESVELILPEGIDYNITSFSKFEWYACEDFSKDVLNNNFVGSVFYDTLNGIVFFNVQNV